MIPQMQILRAVVMRIPIADLGGKVKIWLALA
jgi:hypothetical protein